METLLVHGDQEEGLQGATRTPIFQTTAFESETAEGLEDIFLGKVPGHVYTRLGNPTTQRFERHVALLEGAKSAIATASGTAAIATTVLTIARQGDEIAASSSLFGGTYSLFRDTLSNFGITARFVDPSDFKALKRAINDKTRLVFVETIGNPRLDVVDIERLSMAAHEAGIPLIVDSTVTTPWLVQPGKFGADIVVHSTSKFINGSGSSIGGLIVDMASFDWDSKKFPHYEDLVKRYREFAFSARARRLIHKDIGACAAPFNSYLMSEGIETLGLRMERQCKNALALAEFLKRHEKVGWVNYPGLKDSPFHDLADYQFSGRFGALVTFGIGDKDSAFRFINSLKLARNTANIGDAKTLVIHPASTIFCEYGSEERKRMGVGDDMVRVSAGIEAIEDIAGDFKRALAVL